MSNILLTGGRASAALHLARIFQRAGYTVFMAECRRGHLSQPSRAVRKNFFVPPSRQQPQAFIQSLINIVSENKVDLLIPTSEEIFHVTQGCDQIPCTIFAEPLNKLDALLNKWRFIVSANEFELRTPETMLLTNQDDLLQAFAQWRELVLKPVYSSPAARTMVLPTMRQALFSMVFDLHWIAQEHIQGQHYCTFSICHNGAITAHTTYPVHFTTRQGTVLVFQHIEHPEIFDWVKSYVAKDHFTGQITFDFIQTPDGKLLGLECKPYASGGLHLLASNPNLVDAFLNPQMDCIFPSNTNSHMLSTGMIAYGLPAAIMKKQLWLWLTTFLVSDDVILNYRDPLPFFLQFRNSLSNLMIARRNRISLLEASTFDIEWNGYNE